MSGMNNRTIVGKATSSMHGIYEGVTVEAQGVLQALANGELPPEVVLIVMQHVVRRRCPIVRLRFRCLDDVTIIRREVLGGSNASASLEELFREALIRTGRIRHEIGAGWPVGSPPTKIPAYLTTLPHSLRRLELACSIHISCRIAQQGSAHLVRTRQIIETLPESLPHLEALTLYLKFNAICGHVHSHPASWNTIALRTGYTTAVVLGQLVHEVLVAFVEHEGTKKKWGKGLWQGVVYSDPANPNSVMKKRFVDVSELKMVPNVVHAVFGRYG